jgi:hypothetical protein
MEGDDVGRGRDGGGGRDVLGGGGGGGDMARDDELGNDALVVWA